MFWTIVLMFALGVSVGSFLNVVILRTHRNKSLLKGRSACLTCEIPIRKLDLIPILSYIMLRARCRRCKAGLTMQYPLIELNMGLLFVLAYSRYAHGYALQDYFQFEMLPILVFRDVIFLSFMMLLFVYDFKYQLIPDRFSIPAIISAVLINLFIGVNPISMLIGAIVCGGFFLVQYLLSKGAWIGGGDIRFGILMGVMLGTLDAVIALVLAYIMGAAVGIILVIRHKAKLKMKVPLGMFLAYGTAIALFSAKVIELWYKGLCNCGWI